MVRVRVAPSPTGDPHVGTAYIALFNYVLAKQGGGQLVLRIEDTDQARSRPEWEQMIIDALGWLGLTWDEGPDVGGPYGPYRQSERSAIYREHVDMLVEKGAAYRCFCTPERLAEVREHQKVNKLDFGYDGHCRDLDLAQVKKNLDADIPFVVRLKVPKDGQTTVHDELRGDVVFENKQVDDQVLLKSDGMPTYHLANVVDDHLMEISHVMRAEEWITSTPKHVLLYGAFGWEIPKWIHMPLLRNPGGSKISKRKNPVSLNYYRDAGFLPEAMLNYLSRMGWSMPDEREKFSLEEMVKEFTFDRISLGGPVFDIAKLTWLNGVWIREQSVEKLVERIKTDLFNDATLNAIAPLLHERVDKLEDFVEKAAYFFAGDVTYDDEATKAMVPKNKQPKEAAKILAAVAEVLDGMVKIDVASMEQSLRELGERLEIEAKYLFMPIRVAVTGRKATPPLFETMEVLGKERCRRRLRGAIEHLKTVKQ
ncbi:MAG: glutamate--tRNA ligase [Deltaproteobacteria bacterium RIFOXYA12_FULL_58_15]|nr:MAG: glutamate--tRNA ligase [Deltaproteobacteria bacterium RIFOXYA12_FULL_58_15]